MATRPRIDLTEVAVTAAFLAVYATARGTAGALAAVQALTARSG
jgi:hypothetical protein